jgi:hypothetical protein
LATLPEAPTPNYATAYGTQNNTHGATLAPGVAVQLVGQNFNRHFLVLQNTGTGAVTIGFGAAPVAGLGISLDPASAATGQGGSYEFKKVIPSDAIWAISTAGSTVVAVEGF